MIRVHDRGTAPNVMDPPRSDPPTASPAPRILQWPFVQHDPNAGPRAPSHAPLLDDTSPAPTPFSAALRRDDDPAIVSGVHGSVLAEPPHMPLRVPATPVPNSPAVGPLASPT